MADEPVAGVSVEIGGDAEGFFAALDKCAKAAESFNRRVNNAFERITGVKATQQAEILAKGLEKAGGVAKLTEHQLANLRKEVERLAKAGAVLPQALKLPTLPGGGAGGVLAGNIQTQALAGLQGQLGPLGGLLTGISGGALAATAGVAAFTVAAGAAAKAVAEAVQEFADFSSHLNDLNATTGLSTTALQELAHIGSFAEVSVDEISNAVGKMLLKVQEGDTVFARLGLNLDELRSKRPEEIFFAVAEAINKIQDPALKLTLAKEAFDKLGPAILPIIGNVEALREEAHRFGLVLDESAVKKGAQASDAFNRLDQVLAGLKRNLGAIAADVGVITFFEQLAYWLGQVSLNMPELVSRAGSLYESLFKLAGLDFTGFRDAFAAFFEGKPAAAGTPEQLAAAMAEARKKTAQLAEASPDFVGPGMSFAVTTEADEKKAKALEEERQRATEKAAKARAAALKELSKQEDAIRDASMKEEEEHQKRLMDLDQDAAAHTMALMQDEQQMLDDLLAVELRGRQEAMEAEQALAEARALGLSPLEAERQAISMNLAAKEQQIAKLIEEGKITGEVGAEAVQAYREAAEAELQWAEQQDLINKLGEISGLLGQLPALMDAFGVSADSNLGRIVASFTDIGQSALGFAATLMDPSASIFSKISAGISAGISLIKGIGGLFGKSDMEKAGEIAGRVLGEAVSEELAKAISETAKKLDISKEAASLLHLGDVMDESEASAVTFADEMDELLEGIVLGAVPAEEGIEAMGEAFGNLAEEAAAGSFEAVQAMGAIAQRAKQLGVEVPEIQEAVAAGLDKAAAGTEGLLANVKVTTAQGAAEQAQIFSTVFWAKVQEVGTAEAVQAMAPTFEALEEKLKESGFKSDALDAILGPLRQQFSLVKNEATKGGIAGIDAVNQIFQGLTQAGAVDLATFSALQGQAKAAFDQLIAGGADSKAALMAVSPLLGDMQQQAAALGTSLDPATQALIDQAKAAGIAFPTEPLERTNQLLEGILTQLGGQLPPAISATATAIGNVGTAAAAAGGQVSTSMDAATQALAGMQTSALDASSTILGAFDGVGEQLTTGIVSASDQITSELAGVWDQAGMGLDNFLTALQRLDGTQIEIPFQFSGTGAGGGIDLSGLPHLAEGGETQGPKSGYLAVLHGHEWVTSLEGPRRSDTRGGGGGMPTTQIVQLVLDGRVIAKTQVQNTRRNRGGVQDQNDLGYRG